MTLPCRQGGRAQTDRNRLHGNPSENQNNLISRLATRRELSVGPDWAQDVHLGNQSELRYSYHVVCNQFYHGEACSAYCRPRNDPFGHFSCDVDGRRVCQEGWSGEYCSDRESLLATPPEGATGLVGSQSPLPTPLLPSPPPLLLLHSSPLHLLLPPPLPLLLLHFPTSPPFLSSTSTLTPPLLHFCSFFPGLTSLRL